MLYTEVVREGGEQLSPTVGSKLECTCDGVCGWLAKCGVEVGCAGGWRIAWCDRASWIEQQSLCDCEFIAKG